MHLNLPEEETAALTQELHEVVENHRYPFSAEQITSAMFTAHPARPSGWHCPERWRGSLTASWLSASDRLKIYGRQAI